MKNRPVPLAPETPGQAYYRHNEAGREALARMVNAKQSLRACRKETKVAGSVILDAIFREIPIPEGQADYYRKSRAEETLHRQTVGANRAAADFHALRMGRLILKAGGYPPSH